MAKSSARKIVSMLRCRSYGHVWDDLGWLAMTSNGVRLWAQRFHCPRCLADRDDHRAQLPEPRLGLIATTDPLRHFERVEPA